MTEIKTASCTAAGCGEPIHWNASLFRWVHDAGDDLQYNHRADGPFIPGSKLQVLMQLGHMMVGDWHAKRGEAEVGDALAGYLQELIDTLRNEPILLVSLVSGEGGASYEGFWSIEDAAKQARSWAASVGVVDGPNEDGDTVDVFRLSLSDLSIEGVSFDELPEA